jgi:hypothetical protein
MTTLDMEFLRIEGWVFRLQGGRWSDKLEIWRLDVRRMLGVRRGGEGFMTCFRYLMVFHKE